MNYKFIDIPKYYDMDVYGFYINKYIEEVKKINGVLSIYQIGGIKNPGISDIDLVVVVNEIFNYFDFPKLSVKNVFKNDPIALYLFTHDVAIMDKDSFLNVNYIAYFTNLKYLYGEKLTQVKLQEEEEKVVSFAILVDYTISRLHQFQTTNKSFFSIRNNIIRTSSIKHSIALGRRIGINYDFQQIENKMEIIRNNWFENEDKGLIVDLLNESKELFLKLVIEANKIFQSQILYFAANEYKNLLLMMVDNHAITIFLDTNYNFEKENWVGLTKIFNEMTEKENSLLLYPRELFFHYLTYKEIGDQYFQQKLIGKLTNSNLIFSVQELYKSTVKKRCLYISKFYSFLNRNRIYFSSLIGYPGFKMIDEC